VIEVEHDQADRAAGFLPARQGGLGVAGKSVAAADAGQCIGFGEAA